MKKLVFILVAVFIIEIVPSAMAYQDISVREIMPKDIVEVLEENGISSLDTETLLNLSPEKCLNYVVGRVKEEIDKPFCMVYTIFLIIIITAVASAMGNRVLSSELEKNFSIVGVLCTCTTALLPILSCISQTREYIVKIGGFTEAFVPVLSAVMASSGQVATGTGYSAVVIFASEFFSFFLLDVVLPLLYIYISFSLIGRCVIGFEYEFLASSVRSIVNWSLTLLTTLFVSLVTIRGIIGTGVDSVALRTGRFFIGNFVPAVGGALSEAASTVMKSFEVIKGTTGIFGIITAAVYFIPTLIKVSVYKLTCDISCVAGELLGAYKISGLLKDISTVLGLLNSAILSYGVMIVLTTSVLLVVSKG